MFLTTFNTTLYFSATSLISVLTSGTIIVSAPTDRPAHKARSPQSRPITSTINVRAWLEAVSLILSTHSMIVFNAVSKPIVKSVPLISLSIVPGTPIV